MNFLAHLHLSGSSEKVKIGNFIGDFVRGNPTGVFSPQICRGIFLHRMIDDFTDRHKTVKQSKTKLREKYRHYAGVIVDIFYDHFLAINWNNFSNQPLEKFTEDCYRVLNDHGTVLPQKVNYMIKFMVKENWLLNYKHLEGVGRALYGMSRRTKFDSKMDQAIRELEIHYRDFQAEFLEFYPMLQKKSEQFLHEEDEKRISV